VRMGIGAGAAVGSVTIADNDLGAVGAQVVDQVRADLADAFHADGASRQRGLTPYVLRGSAHALEDAVCGHRRRITGTTVLDGAADNVIPSLGDDVHIAGVGADVTGGNITAAQGLHESAVGP